MYTIFRGEETLQHIDISVVGDTLEANLILSPASHRINLFSVLQSLAK